MGYKIDLKQACPRIPVSEAALKRLAAKILRDLGLKQASLSIMLVDGPEMRRLNRRYLKHAWSTDVLAFDAGQKLDPSAKHSSSSGLSRRSKDFLGDIALGLSTIRAQAKEYEHSFEEELQYCLCHGILHLIGYDDKGRTAFKRMHQKQHQILQRVQKKP